MTPGNARSLSVIANPHVGQATHAIDQRRAAEISSLNGTPWSLSICSRWARFCSGMPVNSMLWWAVRRISGCNCPQICRIAVFNCREDRADRSRQLGEACPSWPAADHYVAIGTGTTIFARAAERAGLDGSKLVFAEDRSVAEVFELLIELAGRSALIMGMGNIGGQGLELVAYFRNRSILTEPA